MMGGCLQAGATPLPPQNGVEDADAHIEVDVDQGSCQEAE